MNKDELILDTSIEDGYEFKNAVDKLDEPKSGKILKVLIVEINADGVLVNLGLKSEGIIPITEFGDTGIPADFSVGKEIPVIIQKSNHFGGNSIVSYKLAKDRLARVNLIEIYNTGEQITGKIIKRIRQGFLVNIGLDAFLPSSEIEQKMSRSLKINDDVTVILIEFTDSNVVVSQKRYIEKIRKISRDKLFSNIKVDDIIEGTVSSITNFGAFVDLGGGFEALLHISDIAWHRINKIEDVLKIGDTVRAKILKISTADNKVSLGLKQLVPHPWQNIEEKYPPGSLINGKVTHITDFGAFIQLEPGVEGLLHISEISWEERINKINDKFKVGDELQLKIIEVNEIAQKLSLSLKRLQKSPWEDIRDKYPVGTPAKGYIVNIAPFGVFIKLNNGLEGLLHLNDISWMKKIKHPNDIYEIGQEIDTIILNIDVEKEKVALSIKHKYPDPYKKYSSGTTVTGKIIRIIDKGAYVSLEPEIEAFVHISEMSAEKIKHPSEIISIGQDIDAKVIKSDKIDKRIEISIKKFDMEHEQDLLNKYSKVENPSLGDVLEEKQ